LRFFAGLDSILVDEAAGEASVVAAGEEVSSGIKERLPLELSSEKERGVIISRGFMVSPDAVGVVAANREE